MNSLAVLLASRDPSTIGCTDRSPCLPALPSLLVRRIRGRPLALAWSVVLWALTRADNPHVAAWIRIEDVSVQPWTLSLVHSQPEATKHSLVDAREAVKAAQHHYVDHIWVPAHISGDTYIVVGQEKPKARAVGSSREFPK
jgi:hypothetical protein